MLFENEARAVDETKMAAYCQKFFSVLTLAVYVYLPLKFVKTDGLPNKIQLEELADRLSDTLVGDFNLATNYEFVTNVYNNRDARFDYSKDFSLKFKKVDPDALVKNYTDKLSQMFERKMQALNRSVIVAEQAAANHTWNNNIKQSDFYCLKAKDMTDEDSGMMYNERFNQWIIPNMSSVHIPVEIYDGDVEILNGLQWSAALDAVFAENYNNDPEILWQYFGSQTGFMRTLPASRWHSDGDVDLFDVRRRPWYTQGSSSPKDMLILIDTSGSVFGQALELIKKAVHSLLDTLSENDFVNIVSFNNKPSNVSDCFKGSFVQASYRNKRKLMSEVDKITANGMADFKAAVEYAFQQFERLERQPIRGASCNRMMMYLTDGSTDYAEEVFKKYNPEGNQTYRVFTYAVGPTANPVAAIRWMACANRGFFSQIPAMGAVRTKVQEYVDVISRPLALYEIKSALWTSIYYGHEKDSEYVPVVGRPPALTYKKQYQWDTIYNDRLGLGMMTTVTLPVYNRTKGSKTTDQKILGVMGIDVTTEAMLKHAPLRELGPNGFPFAINANGYIVFHPKLNVSKELKEPPNVDLLELEVESPEKEQLRNRMIDQVRGSEIMETLTVSEDKRHVDVEKGDRRRQYSYIGIDKTTFSVALSVPSYHKYHLTVDTTIKTPANQAGRSLLNDSYTALLIPDWPFYEGYPSENKTGTILDLQEALENPDHYTWNKDMISQLLFDLTVTSEIDGFWSVLGNNQNSELTNGLVGAFIATVGGLTKIFPKSEDLVNTFMDMRDTWKANYFKRAIDAPHLLFSAPYKNPDVVPLRPDDQEYNDTVADVTVIRSVVIDNSDLDPSMAGQNIKYKAAVLGSVFSHQHLKERMINMSKNLGSIDCSNQETVACHLLDDGAFLIATNQEKHNESVGQFFGKIDPEVMFLLYNLSMFKRLEEFDYSASCLIAQDGAASAGNINIPLMTLFYELLTFNWWSSVMTWTATNFNIFNMLYPAPAEADKYFNMDKTRDCVKKLAQYYFSDVMYIDGQTDCEIRKINCSREFMAQRLKDTNLVLVISEAEKDGCENCRLSVNQRDLVQEPNEATPAEEKEYFCNLQPRYRRITNQCYDTHPNENTKKCRGSMTHPVSMTIISLVTIATCLVISR